MNLENYIIEQFGVTEEDQQGVKNHITKWREWANALSQIWKELEWQKKKSMEFNKQKNC